MEVPQPFRQAKEWTHWYDFLGEKFAPGDYIVYPSISNSSAKMVFAQVDRINRVDSAGQGIFLNDYAVKNRGFFHVLDDTLVSGAARYRGCTVTVRAIEHTGGWRISRNKDGKNRAVTISDVHNKIVRVHDTYMDKFEALEGQLVDQEFQRILDLHGSNETTPQGETEHEQAGPEGAA